MKRNTIARLRRLVRLSEYMYEQRALEVTKSRQLHAELSATLAETRRHLDGDSIVPTIFPRLLANRARRLGQEARAVSADLQMRIDSAAASRANAKGLENKLNRVIAGRVHEQNAQALSEAIDHVVRKDKASLR